MLSPTRHIGLIAFACLLPGLFWAVWGMPVAQADTQTGLETMRNEFESPSRDYSSGPLWVWNDDLSEADIRLTLRELAEQSIKQVWVHPRPGMKTIYLSDDWFDLWGIALDEAEKLDMNVWIYDENSYPSGFAGGHVPAQMPDTRLRGLVLESMQGTQEFEVFFNGEVIGETRASGSLMAASTRPLRVGQRADGETRMKGEVAELWLYEHALDDAALEAAMAALAARYDIEVDATLNPEALVEADFALSEVLADETTLPAGMERVEDDPQGTPFWRMEEEAVFSLPADAAPNLTGSATGLAALRFDDFANIRGIFGQTNGGNPAPVDWYVNQQGQPVLYRGDGQGNNASVYTGTAIPAGEWVILAFRVNLDQQEFTLPPDHFAVYEIIDGAIKRITDPADYDGSGDSRLVTARLQEAGSSPWYGGWYYVDLMIPGVTETFLDVTLEPYRERFGEHFGKRIPGSFTDEPNIRAPGLPWTERLPELFEDRWGYDLMEHLPSLTQEVGDWRKVRHNYFQVLLDTFIDRWAVPYWEYCEEHDLEMTGHYWEHGWPDTTHGPDNMAMSAWQQRPGIDQLFYRYDESISAQFGNVRIVRELNSVANQTGRIRTLCESYGASGWEFRFEDMKRVGDWLYVLGVNTLNQHLSYISLRGARKRDHPPSFSYHVPWFEHYDINAEYFTRLSYALSRGIQEKDILVLEPTTTAWMYQGTGQLGPLGSTFNDTLYALEMAQVPYDLGSEDIMEDHGSVHDGRLVVGEQAYTHVVLPEHTETLNRVVFAQLHDFLEAGGQVLALDEALSRIDGEETAEIEALTTHDGWSYVDRESAVATLGALENESGFAIERAEDDPGILFHMRRQVDGGELLFLVNTSIDDASTGTFHTALNGVEEWNLHTGAISAYPHVQSAGEALEVDFTLPPSGSLLLFLSEESITPPAVDECGTMTSLDIAGPMEIERVAPNVLTLDYVDVTANGETRRNQYVLNAQPWLYQVHGMDGNPWNVSVQYEDSILRREFPEDSGFLAEYVFHIEGDLPESLAAVVEGPEYYTFSINGDPVAWDGESWWLDRRFGKIDIAEHLQPGENRFALHARPFSVHHELESVYLVGDFSLQASERGWTIVPPTPLETGSWREQGMPYYADAVGYRQVVDVPEDGADEVLVSMPDWHGAVAELRVNGAEAGHIAYPPWTCDISDAVEPGANEIEVRIYGTLRNLLGPHHNQGLGLTGPGSFGGAPAEGPPPGEDYFTLDYGLFSPFEVLVK